MHPGQRSAQEDAAGPRGTTTRRRLIDEREEDEDDVVDGESSRGIDDSDYSCFLMCR